MKKVVVTLFAFFLFMAIQAQGVFKIGGVAAFPLVDAGDVSGFGLGADMYYMFGREDAIVNFGPTVGFRNYFAKENDLVGTSIKQGDTQFMPLAGAFRGKILGLINWGSDIGYTLAINEDSKGGLFFRPVVGIDIADKIEINASYEYAYLNSAAWQAFTAGILIEFGK